MGYKVLLVEDDHDIREAVADYFIGVEASEMNVAAPVMAYRQRKCSMRISMILCS